MSSPGASNKRRSLGNQHSMEEQALNIIAKEAEIKEEKSSAILAEARKIRSSEREKNKKNDDDDDDYGEGEAEEADNSSTPSQHAVSAPRPMPVTRPVLEHLNSRDGVVDVQENYKKLMMSNAQLDNEKQTLNYELELYKDLLGDKNEEFLEMKSRLNKVALERDRLVQDLKEEKAKCERLNVDVLQRDHLIKSSGLSLVTVDNATPPPMSDVRDVTAGSNMAAAVLTADHLEMLADYSGSLGERLKQLFEGKLATAEENKQLQKEIESLKSNQLQNASHVASPLFTPSLDDTHKQYTETKLKLKRAEQEITTLHGTVTRLETQMLRYKTSAEDLEKAEEELKSEKRKLQIELREFKSKVEELEAKNGLYLKRIEKLKSKNVLVEN